MISYGNFQFHAFENELFNSLAHILAIYKYRYDIVQELELHWHTRLATSFFYLLTILNNKRYEMREVTNVRYVLNMIQESNRLLPR